MIPVWLRALALMPLLLDVAGCAGVGEPLSPRIAQAPPGNLQLVEAVADPDGNEGRPVRWGGKVVEVTRAGADSHEVVVLERRLTQDGEPLYRGPSDGRFVFRATSKMSPSLYRPGTDITVAGSFAGMVTPSTSPDGESLPLVVVTDVENWGYGPYAFPAWPYYDPRDEYWRGYYPGMGFYFGHPQYWPRHHYPYRW